MSDAMAEPAQASGDRERPWPFTLVAVLAHLVAPVAGALAAWWYWGSGRYVRDERLAAQITLGALSGFLAGWLWCLVVIPRRSKRLPGSEGHPAWHVLRGMLWGTIVALLATMPQSLVMMGFWPRGSWSVADDLGPVFAINAGVGLVGGTMGGLLMAAADRLARRPLRSAGRDAQS